MAIEDFISSTISLGTSTLSRPGFGTLLILAQNLPSGFGAGPVKTYRNLKDLTADGFGVSHPVYLAAVAIKSQNPSPKSFKVARRTSGVRTIKLTCKTATEGAVYSVVIDGKTVSYTVPAAATTTTVAAAIASLVAPTSNSVTATSALAVVTLAAASGVVYNVKDWSDNLEFLDDSVDPGLASDFANLIAVDSDFAGVVLDVASKAEIVALSSACEAQRVLFVASTCDSVCKDALVTNDVMSTVKSTSKFWTAIVHHNSELLNNLAVSIVANRFPFDPGKDTWNFKTLPGVVASKYVGAEEQNIWAKNGNTYTQSAGVNAFHRGTVASGEFIDVVRFRAWLDAELKIRVYALLLNSPKVPYTDAGIDSIVSVIYSVLSDGIRLGGLANDPAPVVTAPKALEVDSLTRGQRILPDVEWSARLAGAVHEVNINGVLTN